MAYPSSDVYGRVGLVPEQRLRWLLGFGNLDPTQLDAKKRTAVIEEARAFLVIQEVDPAIRKLLRSWPAPRDDTPDTMSEPDVWRAQGWLRHGLDALRRGKIWSFAPRVRYEVEIHKALLFWARLRANRRLELFKALVYDALRDARFSLRLCPECQRPFVPTRRQAYCSARCSQAVRTRKWRKAHPEKNRAIRRNLYRKSVATKLGISPAANNGIRPSRARSAE